MATLFSSFPPDKRRRISSTQPLSLAAHEKITRCQNQVLQQDAHTLSLCGNTSGDFNTFMEVDNISQKSG